MKSLLHWGVALSTLLVFGCSERQDTATVYGEIEIQDMRVGAKVAGRLDQLAVETGDWVAAGDLLFVIDSPELHARRDQAQAARDAANAALARTDDGARDEEITMARLDWQRAVTQAELLRATHNRLETLHHEGLVARQQFDESRAAWRAAEDQMHAAEARYQLAREGAHVEERRASAAQLRQAEAALAEVSALLTDVHQYAPVRARVENVVMQPGELVPTGAPVVTLVNPDDQRLMLMVREDLLGQFQPGDEFQGYVPALGEHLTFRVRRLQALPDFATWRQGGDVAMHLRTFQVEARPLTPHPALLSGMTVTAEVPR
ncbi:efflux RND transporter periplasmic adaptor subunit [Salinispirillum sp. LH 10-3-1]|uniref:Efflux RND transporter periplasmic adaptor subunit n=1 Tax=Salinispirillum sp. LH 10-3-1 TaxID=2952525 RepID=A0AB38YJ94_9GAMM